MSYEDFIKNHVKRTENKIISMMNIIIPSGDWKQIEGVETIINGIISQLLIPKGSYIFDPEFGENILQFLFQPSDTATMQDVQRVVDAVIEQNRYNADITSEVLLFSNRKGFRINIIINTNGSIKKIPINIDERLLKDWDK